MLRKPQPLLQRFVRSFCSSGTVHSNKTVFITTPIYYANDKPHIGHLYSTLLADGIARWYRTRQRSVFLTTGTDEHGIKIQRAAKKQQIEPKNYCEQVSDLYKQLFDKFHIKYDRFVRTTEEEHRQTVCHFWNELNKNQHFSKGSFEGWYCPADEEFVTIDETHIDPATGKRVSTASGREVEHIQESHYEFNLASQRGVVDNWLKKPESVYPSEHRLATLKSLYSVPDKISVSRELSRVQWAITVPDDPQQGVYVWLDALVNYLTVVGYPKKEFASVWPPDYQIIGKDIVKFHAIFWPAFLSAAKLELPKSIVTHGHWTKDRLKMSKSAGNFVDPLALLDTYPVDVLRLYLLKDGAIDSDGDFSFESLDKTFVELANHYGNLLSRSTSKLVNPQQIYPTTPSSLPLSDESASDYKEIIEILSRLRESVQKKYEVCDFAKAIPEIFSVIRQANVYFATNQPWTLAKAGKQDLLDQTIHLTYEVLRITSILLLPIIPDLAGKCLDALSVPQEQRVADNAVYKADHGSAKLPESSTILLPKLIGKPVINIGKNKK